jgi:fatty acid desaturase
MNEANDERLQNIARKRADFRKSLYSYVAVIVFLWIIWWITTGRITGFTGYPWPVWITLGWGVSLAIQYFKAYKVNKKELADEDIKS